MLNPYLAGRDWAIAILYLVTFVVVETLLSRLCSKSAREDDGLFFFLAYVLFFGF